MASPCLLPQGRKWSSEFKASFCSSQQQRRGWFHVLRSKSRMSRVWNQSRTTSGRRRYALYSRPQQQHCRHHSLHQLSSSPFVSVESCCRIHRNSSPAATTIAATRAMMLRGGSSSSTMEKGLQQQQQQQQSFAVEEEEEEATVLGKLALRPSVGELVVFKEGKSPEQLRAAAYLRAMCFYTFPEGRSEEALKLHCKMKAEDEWSALKLKVTGLEQRYKRTACILALCPLSELADSSLSVNPSCKVVLANGEAHSVVGSLDLNQGIQIPGQLSDDYSEKDVDAEKRRGYLSNVCVAPEVRKQGVGAALLQRAQEIAHVWGVTDLYVHVLANNQAALMLYTKGGFLYENEEMTVSSHARMQSRPHCLLLHKRIQKLKST